MTWPAPVSKMHLTLGSLGGHAQLAGKISGKPPMRVIFNGIFMGFEMFNGIDLDLYYDL